MIIKCPGITTDSSNYKRSNILYSVVKDHQKRCEYIFSGGYPVFVRAINEILSNTIIIEHGTHNRGRHNEIKLEGPEVFAYADKITTLDYEIVRRCGECVSSLLYNSLFDDKSNIELVKDFYNHNIRWMVYGNDVNHSIILADWHNGIFNMESIIDKLDRELWKSLKGRSL